jgi:UDP-glucose:(glucosyl)LPS alpha-1,2-glucosyltransferase
MSCIYKGNVIDTELSRNSKGGTEMMRSRLLKYANENLLSKVAIHFSRPRELYNDVANIMYAHDLATDPENKILENDGWKKFDHFVFVSHWQRDQYIMIYGIPYSKCSVIPNAIELEYEYTKKQTDTIRFIYHTTPHRGLQLAYPIFDALSKEFDNIHLDVFSSFAIYGWEKRDRQFDELFTAIRSHKHMTYHGVKRNDQVIDALKKSHIFLYPSIWMETSCIAMIEAIRSGCVVIHPSYGALSETSAGATVMYDMTEDPKKHAAICYDITRNILLQQKENKELFNMITANTVFELPRHDVSTFSNSWNSLLEKITND